MTLVVVCPSCGREYTAAEFAELDTLPSNVKKFWTHSLCGCGHIFEGENIIIDCTEIDLNMNEMEALISRVSRQMKDSLPNDTDPSDVQVIIKKYLRKLICRIPTRWTTPVVKQFLERFQKTLDQLGVSIN